MVLNNITKNVVPAGDKAFFSASTKLSLIALRFLAGWTNIFDPVIKYHYNGVNHHGNLCTRNHFANGY